MQFDTGLPQMGTRDLPGRVPITYSSAEDKEDNILHQLKFAAATKQLCNSLWESRDTICALVRHHLRLSSSDACIVSPMAKWIPGGFNVCIPIGVGSQGRNRLFMFRCPMPHKLAESKYPGTVDEKLGSEVGTYAWMQDKCPDVRIPFLYGFGFSDQCHFTHMRQRPFLYRWGRSFWRWAYKVFRWPTLSCYTPNPTMHNIPAAYMLLEHIGPSTGQMLSKTWNEHRQDPRLRQTLFRGIAHLIISLARLPQQRIGAFHFNNDCTVTLSNRPLTCTMMILENNGAPRTVERDTTYTYTEPFVSDLIELHDRSFLSDPNAVNHEADCREQMAYRTVIRALSYNYIRRNRSGGHFVLQFTDFHASNIFVDDEWNITCILDLEWVCALPAEMFTVPYWITGRGIGSIQGDDLVEFSNVRQELMLEIERQELLMTHSSVLTNIMQETWESKGAWFWHCLKSTNAMFVLFRDHICPAFSADPSSASDEFLAKFWRHNSDEIVELKLSDRKQYSKDLRLAFEKPAGSEKLESEPLELE